jgi:hypothetical protein
MPTIPQLQTFSLYGNLNGTQWVAPPNAQLVSNFVYYQDYWITGYSAWIYGFQSFAPVPVLAMFGAVTIGPSQPNLNIPVPFTTPQGYALGNVLFSIRPDLSYIPAVAPRPELLTGAANITATFQDEQSVYVPAGQNVCLYLTPGELSIYDGVFMGVTIYARTDPPIR